MMKHRFSKFRTLAAGALLLPTLSWAGAEVAYQEAKPLIKATEESRIRGDLGINVVSQ